MDKEVISAPKRPVRPSSCPNGTDGYHGLSPDDCPGRTGGDYRCLKWGNFPGNSG